MKLLLRKAIVISPGSPHHLKEKDLLIDGKSIAQVGDPGKLSSEGCEVIQQENLHVSTGWFDLHANLGEPGFETRETIETGSAAARQGGYTGVLIMPTTNPPVTGRTGVEYILHKAKNSIVTVHVAGSISENMEGKELSEMYDMHLAGARVFTDDKKPVQDSGLMMRALLYSSSFGGRIFSFAEDDTLVGKGIVHEGEHALALGLKGIPSVAEEIMITRDLALAEYADSPIHFSTISSRRSVELIRNAKSKGQKITADVSAAHLLLDDSVLQGFNSVYKVKPPFRSSDDRKALIEGLKDGTIDCICSDHMPLETENKKKEFFLADYGAAGLETAFAVARTATKGVLSVPELISKFTIHSRLCAGLSSMMIAEGQDAELTLFDPDAAWKVSQDYLKSKSDNNPFLGQMLTGKPLAIINQGKIEYCK